MRTSVAILLLIGTIIILTGACIAVAEAPRVREQPADRRFLISIIPIGVLFVAGVGFALLR